MKVELQLDARAVAPGVAVRGRVLVLDGGRARGVRAALEFCELVPRAFEAVPTIRRAARTVGPETIHESELEHGALLPFSLELPGDALPNLRTYVGELRWELVVTVDRPLIADLEERLQLEVGAP